MPRLHQSEISNHLAEDHTCPGCDRDHMDCACGEFYEDLYFDSNWDQPEPEDEALMDQGDDRDLYDDASWWFESDRLPIE